MTDAVLTSSAAMTSSSLFDSSLEVLQGAQTEILLFLVAFVAHSIIFGKHRAGQKTGPSGGKAKTTAAVKSPRTSTPPPTRATSGSRLFTSAPETKDYSEVVAELTKAVRQLMRESASHGDLESQVLNHLRGHSSDAVNELLAGLLEAVARAATADLLAAVRGGVREHKVPINARLGELLLRGYLGLRLLSEFGEVLRELEDNSPLSPACAMLALRCELCVPNLEAALARLKGVAPLWSVPTPSAVQKGVMQQLSRLASEKTKLPALLRALEDNQIAVGWTVELLLVECHRTGDSTTMRLTEARARALGVELTVAAYCALLRGAPTTQGASQIFEEAIGHGLTTDDLLAAAAERATADSDSKLAGAVLKKMPKTPTPELSTQVVMLGMKGPLRGNSADKSVLDLYEKHLMEVDILADARTGRTVAEAALKYRRQDLFQTMLVAASEDPQHTPRRLALIRGLAAEYRLEAARGVLKACPGNAASLLAALAEACVTGGDLASAWKIVEEMSSTGVKPSHNLCLGLLKGLTNSHNDDAERVVALLDSVEGGVDEGLLSAFCEACIRIGKTDLLKRQLKRWHKQQGVVLQGAHAVGSIIRAYGFVKDITGVWATWREMNAANIIPTRITLGCMVEALATNNEVDAGYEVIHEALANPQLRHLVNAVIYCSVMKGFSHQKRFDRVWQVYQEMVKEKLQFSIVTFNTLIDACARSCEMGRIPQLLESMSKQGIEPNVITYSAVLKGYCQENRIDKAFEVLADMRASKRFMPDEVTYNSILDGCARHGMYDRGMAVLEEMQEAGVNPSNFTLSVLVKLMTRCRKTDMAFQMCDELCQKYRLKPNAHVYANLVHACTMSGDINRAFGVLERMLSERVKPDARTYGLMMRACVYAGEAQQAAGLLRAALGLGNVHPKLASFSPYLLQPKTPLPSDLISEVLETIGGRCGEEGIAVQLFRDLRRFPGKLDPKLSLRLTSRAVS